MSKLTRVRMVDAEGQPTSAGQPDRISRRGFLRGVGAAGLAVAGASGVVSLLTSSGGESPSSTPIPNIGGLSGIVQSSAGPTISGATVTLTGGTTNRSAVTDANGAFIIEGLLTGSYVLTITKTGYITLAIPNFVMGTGPMSVAAQ